MRLDHNKQLRKAFRCYNKLYFNNQLEEPDIVRYSNITNEGASGLTTWQTQGATKIQIHSGLKKFEKLSCIVLLHEMAHLAVGLDCIEQHGIRYQAEIYRLIMAGAYDSLL